MNNLTCPYCRYRTGAFSGFRQFLNLPSGIVLEFVCNHKVHEGYYMIEGQSQSLVYTGHWELGEYAWRKLCDAIMNERETRELNAEENRRYWAERARRDRERSWDAYTRRVEVARSYLAQGLGRYFDEHIAPRLRQWTGRERIEVASEPLDLEALKKECAPDLAEKATKKRATCFRRKRFTTEGGLTD